MLALLASCRVLTTGQVQALVGGRDRRVLENRLRGLAGDRGSVKYPDVGSVPLRRLRYRAFDGAPRVLWTPTGHGLRIAEEELGRDLPVPRRDVAAPFAEHAVALTELFVRLAAPFVQAGVAVKELPFRWNVTEDAALPWRAPGADGLWRDRVIVPDAILEVPSARRRLFVECETGSHTLVPRSPDKPGATVRKAERYETFLRGLADVPRRVTHYAAKYPDGWAAEVLFLVRTEGRRLSTEAALARVEASRQVTFRVFTLEGALGYVRGLLRLATSPTTTPRLERVVPSPGRLPRFP